MTRTKLLLALALLAAAGCNDPTDAQRQMAAALDLSRIYGEVTAKNVKFYETDYTDRDIAAGQSYLCMTIRIAPAAVGKEFCPVSREIYDAVGVGTQLPQRMIPVLPFHAVAALQGKIIDMVASPAENTWTIVVDHTTSIETYRVDAVTYYRHLDLGMRLPITPDDEAPTALESFGK